MTPLDLDCDVAIVGAGPAGCTIAWDLAPTYHVVLLEAAVDGLPRVGEVAAAGRRPTLAQARAGSGVGRRRSCSELR